MRKTIIGLILILSLLVGGCNPMSTMYEYNTDTTYTVAAGVTYKFYGAILLGQTFTPDTNHTITFVRLRLARTGSPGTITVNIKATAAGLPDGAALATGTYTGNTLSVATSNASSFITVPVSLGAGTALTSGTVYAIELSAAGGDGSNYVEWLMNGAVGGAYADGKACRYSGSWGFVSSSSSGITYADFIFEEWNGDPDHVVPIAAIGIRMSRPVLFTPIRFDVPLCTAVCEALPFHFDQFFTVPVCALTCAGIQGTHAHNLNHPILRPSYKDTPITANRIFVTGVDINSKVITGEATNANAIASYGNVILPFSSSSITTMEEANMVAANILAKSQRKQPLANVVIPPHLGLEVGDVIEIDDEVCNQAHKSYRVSGWQLTYQSAVANLQDGRFEQSVTLTGV